MNTDNMLSLLNTQVHNPSFFLLQSTLEKGVRLIDFCVPVNHYFPPEEMYDLIKDNLKDILTYYPDYADTHQQHLSQLTGIEKEHIVAANGSTEIITYICREAIGPIMTTVPTFGRWTDLPDDFSVPVVYLHHPRTRVFELNANDVISVVRREHIKTLILCNPNNPTGAWFPENTIEKIINELADLALLVIDESFIDFSNLKSASELAIQSNNVMVVKSLGKSLGWHGIRLGYSVSNVSLATHIRKQMPYWNINGLAAFVLSQTVNFRTQYQESFQKVIADRKYMAEQLKTVDGLTVFPSRANFIYCALSPRISGKLLRNRLLKDFGLFIRECSNKIGASESYLRIAVTRRADVDQLIAAMKLILKEGI